MVLSISHDSDDSMLIHVCEEPGCGQVFDTNRSLASHMKRHRTPSMCPECGQKVRYLGPHLRSKHGPDEKEHAALSALQALIEENRSLRQQVTELKARLEGQPEPSS